MPIDGHKKRYPLFIMKYFGSILDFTRQRNDDIMRAYREQLHLTDYIVRTDILEKVAQSPASRFWVSEKRAAIVISRLEAGKPLPRMLPTKREMFEEIYRRYIALRKMHPHQSTIDLATIIVNQPAPKFYYTPSTVGELIYRIKNGWYDRNTENNR